MGETFKRGVAATLMQESESGLSAGQPQATLNLGRPTWKQEADIWEEGALREAKEQDCDLNKRFGGKADFPSRPIHPSWKP